MKADCILVQSGEYEDDRNRMIKFVEIDEETREEITKEYLSYNPDEAEKYVFYTNKFVDYLIERGHAERLEIEEWNVNFESYVVKDEF